MSLKQAGFIAATTTLLAGAAAAHEGHGAPLLHLHDAEMLGFAALAALALAAVAVAAWMWFYGRK